MNESPDVAEKVQETYKELLGGKPLLVRSPGRVNLLGEHTDYNLGFVLPAAITKAIYFAIGRRNDDRCTILAVDVHESHQFSLNDVRPSPRMWPNYIMGVVDQLVKGGHAIGGFDCAFGGDIPIGAGLSSSAALEAGLTFALDHLFSLGLDRLSMVKLAQKAENEYVGVQCGIMDQYVNIFGKCGHALRIDCRTLEHTYVPFDTRDAAILLMDTQKARSLACSAYNRRRAECAEGVGVIRRDRPDVESLRDVTPEQLAEYQSRMDPTVFRRCRFVVGENARVLKACERLAMNDVASFGSLMNRTHEGLRDDYEVSCTELDVLAEAAAANPRVYGSRMMGAGFGGCTINLVERDAVEDVQERLSAVYEQRFHARPGSYVTSIAGGTAVVWAGEGAAVCRDAGDLAGEMTSEDL